MKRLFVTIGVVIALGICAAIPSFVNVHGQNGKFRRVKDGKKIQNQYIVVLKDDADPDVEVHSPVARFSAVIATAVTLTGAHSKVFPCA